LALRSISLCSGIEGLGRGVELALDVLGMGPLQPLLYVEREAFPAAYLASQMEQGELAAAPIWSDLGTVTGAECGAYLRACPKPDILFGGIPCQPWSVAGKQAGKADERDLWPLVEDLIEFLDRPEYIFLENVSGFTVWDGLGRVAGSLRAMGYRVAAILLGAGDVGASHRRKRLFVLAHCEKLGRTAGECEPVRERTRIAGLEGVCDELANPSIPRSQRSGEGLRGLSSLPLFPPGPNDFDAWARVLEIDPGLAPAVADAARDGGNGSHGEAGSGRRVRGSGDEVAIAANGCARNAGGGERARRPTEGQTPEPALRGVADGSASTRLHELRVLGNGVVPICAAYAFVALLAALEGD